ncbi:MAG: hypothetical protein IJ567_00455 [Lachnospiraceae bacterium]|nr:hypothetical protein [Lachnospiraceae bacterium]
MLQATHLNIQDFPTHYPINFEEVQDFNAQAFSMRYLTGERLIDTLEKSLTGRKALHSGRRLANISRKGVRLMRITLHIGKFTVTIIVKSNNRHSAK